MKALFKKFRSIFIIKCLLCTMWLPADDSVPFYTLVVNPETVRSFSRHSVHPDLIKEEIFINETPTEEKLWILNEWGLYSNVADPDEMLSPDETGIQLLYRADHNDNIYRHRHPPPGPTGPEGPPGPQGPPGQLKKEKGEEVMGPTGPTGPQGLQVRLDPQGLRD